jgi:hypothetical protein
VSTRPVITANDEYVMFMDIENGTITRVATELYSTLSLSRAVEELSAVLGNRLRREARDEQSGKDRPDASGGRV